MSKINIGDVVIASEDLDFPSSAEPTDTQVGQKVATLLKERNELRKTNEAQQKRIAGLVAAERRVKELECDNFFSEAVRAFKIDKAQVEHLKKMWMASPASAIAVKEYVDSLRAKAFLVREDGIGGDDESPVSASAEFDAKVLEVMGSDKSMSQGQAMAKVMADPKNVDLMERRRTEMLTGAKGGDR